MILSRHCKTIHTSMASPIRLAILECDRLLPDRKEYGGYYGVYSTLMYAAADALSIPRDRLDISKWDVVNEMDQYPALEEIDAVLISGSSM